MKKHGWKILIAAGLIWAAGFALAATLPTGAGFLMLTLALLGLAAAGWGVLLIPYKNERARRFCRGLRRVCLALAALALISAVVVEALIFSGVSPQPNEDAPCIIVLGAGLYGERPSASLVSRLQAAESYLSAHPDAVAVVTGGKGPGESITEAEAMKRWLTARGVAPERVYMEDRATDTQENMEFSAELLRGLGLEKSPVVVVTNTFHMYRSLILAREAGLEASGLAAPVPRIGLVPLSCYVREYFCVVYMYLFE